MPRNRSKAVPKDNGLILHQDEFESREPTMADLNQMFEEGFDKINKNLDKKLDELMERTRKTKQRVAGMSMMLGSHFSPWRQT